MHLDGQNKMRNINQRTNGPVNDHLISGSSKKHINNNEKSRSFKSKENIHLNLVQIAEQILTLILITHGPSFNHPIYNINNYMEGSGSATIK